MFKVRYCLILLIAALFDRVFAYYLYEGDDCKLSSGKGECKDINECRSTFEEWKWDARPARICQKEGNRTIVCCRYQAPTLVDGAAKRMCTEYAKAAFSASNVKSADPPVCARRRQPRIYRGRQVRPKEFPHMAALGYGSGDATKWACGGTLISDRFVLTAAHCVNDTFWGLVQRVRLGDINLASSKDDAHVQEFGIAQRIVHEDYKYPVKYHDVALLELDGQVRFDSYVRPACLSTRYELLSGENVVATGWGITSAYEDEGSDELLKATLPIIPYNLCHTLYFHDSEDLPNKINPFFQFCAGTPDTGDACSGDSGGPLVSTQSHQPCMHELVGVTSFGKVCGKTFGVYEKVQDYLTWIERIVW